MIEEIDGRPEGTLEFKIAGRVTGADYDKVLVPAIEAALEQHDRIRLLCQVGPGFEGYDLEAAWDDARLGLRHWSGFDRIAIVTNVAWISSMVRALGFALPCPIADFALDELKEARLWLGESLGSIHIDKEEGLVRVALLGKLDSAVYARAETDLDQVMASMESVHLLVDLSDFDGWQGLSALGEHLSLVRDHRHVPQRIAVLGNKAWQKLAERVFSRFVTADVRFFEVEEADRARAWLRETST